MAKSKTPVRARIIAAAGLPMGPRNVLAEVCAMCENGGRGCFDANNRYLATALGLQISKVSAHLHLLERIGLLVIEAADNESRRTIRPAERLVWAYRNDKGTPYQNDKGLIEMISPTTLTEMIRGAYQNDKPPLIKTVSPPYQNDKHTSKELVKGLVVESVLPCKGCPNAFAALAAAQKKIAELEARLVKGIEVYGQLKAENETLRAEAEALPAQSPKKPARVAGPPKQPAPPLTTPKPASDDGGRKVSRAWQDWYQVFNNGLLPPDLLAKDHVAAKEIFRNMRKQDNVADDEGAVALFSALLHNWRKLEPFHQKHFTLNQISSNLTNLIPQLIHHGKSNQSSQRAAEYGLVDTNQLAISLQQLRALGI